MPDINLIPHPLVGTPMGAALDLCVILAALCWLAAVITREYSWVDRLWSLCPPIYCLIVAFANDFGSTRVNLMTALAVLWGARLTFNFVRKGGYQKGGEDYRWATVRERYGPIGIQIMNITFIAPGQMLLIWWFTSPVHAAWEAGDTPLNGLDFLAAALFLLFLIVETVADEQMWAFQQDKRRRIADGEDVAQPFMNTGLFRYSRHPNYLCELGMWWVFYLFAVAASGQWIHWTGAGFVALTALFVGSIRLSESISAQKYPSYRDYQASVPCIIPGLRLGKP
jgi:steroid 5-alpha reductase family enzyme